MKELCLIDLISEGKIPAYLGNLDDNVGVCVLSMLMVTKSI